MAKAAPVSPPTVREVSTSDLARAWGITLQAVRKLAASGMPCERVDTPGKPAGKGDLRFNTAEAEAWRRKHSTGAGHGGNRKTTPPEKVSAAHGDRGWTKDSAGVQRALEEEEAAEVAGAVLDEGLEEQSQAKLWCILQAEKIRMARVERAIKEQKYVKADDAMKAFTNAARGAAKQLRGMGRTLAPRIISRLGVATTPENTAAAREVIDQFTDHVSATLARCEFAGGGGPGGAVGAEVEERTEKRAPSKRSKRRRG